MAVLLEVPLLAAFAACCVMIALAYAYKQTLGAVLQHLAELLAAVAIPTGVFGSIHPLRFAADALEALDNAILATLGAGIQGTEWAYHKLLHYQAYVWQEVSGAIADLAENTWHRFDRAITIDVPRIVDDAITAARGAEAGTIRELRRAVASVEAEATRDLSTLRRDLAAAEHTIGTRISRAERAALAATAAAVAGTLPRIRTVERDLSDVRARLRGIGRTLTPAGIAGLVLAAIGALGLGWVRCSRVGKLGRSVCGMNESLLESLLADALVIASTVSIVEIAKECQSFTRNVETPLRAFVRELRDVNPVKPPNASAALARYAAGRY